jgi:hypothetical protein
MIGNEPAFPVIEDFKDTSLLDSINPHYLDVLKTGMTIRQYFVAQAMQGLLANYTAVDFPKAEKDKPWLPALEVTAAIYRYAVQIADACLTCEAKTRKAKP